MLAGGVCWVRTCGRMIAARIRALKSKAENECASGGQATACQEGVPWRVRCGVVWFGEWRFATTSDINEKLSMNYGNAGNGRGYANGIRGR